MKRALAGLLCLIALAACRNREPGAFLPTPEPAQGTQTSEELPGGSGGPTDTANPPPAGTTTAYFVLDLSSQNPNDQIVIAFSDAAQVAEARRRAAQNAAARVIGSVAAGHGGFNYNPKKKKTWEWHLTPASVRFAEGSTEACEEKLAQVSAGGRYCPSGQLVAELSSSDVADNTR